MTPNVTCNLSTNPTHPAPPCWLCPHVVADAPGDREAWERIVGSLNTWRIIPVSKWLITRTMAIKSPKDRVVGPLPNSLFMAYKWEFFQTTYDTWDHPPRYQPQQGLTIFLGGGGGFGGWLWAN